MFERLLPHTADNTFRGHKAALWLFGIVAAVKGMQGLGSMLNTYATAVKADGIPLASYSPAAASTVLALFSLHGFELLLMALLGILVLVRYRSLVPLMFIVLALQYLGARVVLNFLHPLTRTGQPVGIYVNLALFALMVVGLVLSLIRRA